MNWQQPIPRSYTQLPTDEVVARIAARKTQLADNLIILGHHYQQDNVIRFADITGDSFQLSREAAKLTRARYIIFCGVHFMAESADILTADHQQVILPDLGAGCSMADMAQLEDVEDAWNTITEACRDLPDFQLLPITYMNSAASLKSFVGEHGGAVCTSSNCEKILKWALNVSDPQNRTRSVSEAPPSNRTPSVSEAPPSNRTPSVSEAPPQNRTPSVSEGQPSPVENSANRKIIFFPDQHLGRNTAYQMGYPLESMVVWDYKLPSGGLTEDQIRHAIFILWKGHCSVHQLFRPEHVDQARQKYPGVKVIVHPECRFEVVQKADLSGSTDFIGKTIAAAPPDSTWAIGTEVHMVNRLAHQHPGKKIITLSECQCLCTTMYRIDPPHLLYILDNLAEGKVLNQITVAPHTKYWARVSLQRMLDITAGTKVSDPPGTPPEKDPAPKSLRVLTHS